MITCPLNNQTIMKKFITPITSLVVAIGLLAGCASTPSNQAVTTTVITIAVAAGSTAYIQSHPTTRPDFVAADIALTALTGQPVTTAQVESALQSTLGAQTPAVSVIVTDLIPLVESYAASNSTNSTTANAQIVLGAVLAGLNQGLAATAPVTPVVPTPAVVPAK